jgi:OOP family OmpA-OmpF porin
VTRYTGSIIDGYEVRDFDEYTLPIGPAVKDAASQRVPSKKETLEGKITRILYRGPEGRSTLEILRNYQAALEAAGFDILFSCADKDCGYLFHWIFYKERKQRILNTKTSGSAFDILRDLRYLAAKGPIGGVTGHVSVLVAFDAGFSKLSKRPVTLLEVIDATGYIAIYGVYFDTNSAEIKPESSPTLQEISKLLQSRPSLKLQVVGHTDSQGGYEDNMDLSRRRADAVAAPLAGKHGIDSGRLRAAGVGPLAPLASNDTPEGRAKNRRVALVKQ